MRARTAAIGRQLKSSRVHLSMRRALRSTGLTAPSVFLPKGVLSAAGWPRSVRLGVPVDRHGNPIPWYTYSAIEFLDERIQSVDSVFEFGTGQSTLWYSARVNQVYAVEHDKRWYQALKEKIPSNVHATLAIDRESYVSAANEHGRLFDLVAIDGIHRRECVGPTMTALSDAGVIIWDNSDRLDFAGALPEFTERGFRVLRFRGLGPVQRIGWETAVLYRSNNCLGI